MTRQIRDTLIYKGNEYDLNEEILEKYFCQFPEKKPEINGVMTACWRGYVVTFEILDEALIIKEIDWLVFGDEMENDKVYPFTAGDRYTWFSGLIRIDGFRGDFDDEDDENGIYELLEIRDGAFVSHWKLNYEEFCEFKEILFHDFKETADYELLFAKWKNNNPDMKWVAIDKQILKNIVSNVTKI